MASCADNDSAEVLQIVRLLLQANADANLPKWVRLLVTARFLNCYRADGCGWENT